MKDTWLPLYEEFKQRFMNEINDFEVHETSKAIIWRHSSSFAEITAKKDCLVIAFASDTLHDDWQPSKTLQTSKHRMVHYFEVVDNTNFDVLVERLVKAYHLTKSNRPRKNKEVIEYKNVDEYINLFDKEIKEILLKTRDTIHQAAPEAIEKISWQMPTFYFHENVIHFAVGKHHLGIYPGASGVANFLDKLVDYKTSKGAIQFPFNKEIPYALIAEITRFRMQEIKEQRGL
jgi:uncharacterized protein YdhG (YjbR/CyaY superfamily)